MEPGAHWTPLDTHHPPKHWCRLITPTQCKGTPQQYLPRRTICPSTATTTTKKLLRNSHKIVTKAQSLHLYKFPRHQSNQASLGHVRSRWSLAMDRTWLWPINAWTQDLLGCPAIEDSRCHEGVHLICLSPRSTLHFKKLISVSGFNVVAVKHPLTGHA